MTTPEPMLPASRQPMPGPQPLPQPATPVPRPESRTPAEIEADIAVARERLAGTIDQLVEQVKPRNVTRRMLGRLKARLTTDEGSVRPEVIGAAAGVVLVVGLLVWRGRRNE